MSAYQGLFYKPGTPGSVRSAEKVVPELVRLLAPQSVIDVGCGIGTWARAFRQNGVKDILAIDGAHVPRSELLIEENNFRPADLFEPLNIDREFDLALTVEVAEHLPGPRAKGFVADLVRLAPAVAFSAAIPGQGGTNHINEQWPEYWVQLFAEFDYVAVDCLRPQFWNDPDVEYWYRQNLILFIRKTHLDNYPELKKAERIPRVLPLAHPELVRRLHHALNLTEGYSDLDPKSLETVGRVQPFTRAPAPRIFALCQAIRHIVRNQVPGDLVECGVWRGGGAMAMARTLLECGERERNVYLYDTFGGMTMPGAKDLNYLGTHGLSLMQRSDKLAGEIWSDASMDDVKSVVESVGYDPGKIHCVKGRVEDTIPQFAPERIAFLRLDTNWHRSTSHELQHLVPRVQPGGFILIDGYGYWRGCREAVDEYFAKDQLPVFFHRVDFSARMGMIPRR